MSDTSTTTIAVRSDVASRLRELRRELSVIRQADLSLSDVISVLLDEFRGNGELQEQLRDTRRQIELTPRPPEID